MHVALYARVSTAHQPQEGTMASHVPVRTADMRQQAWSLLPAHASLDDGVSGTRLDRPGLDRLRDGAQRGECDAVVVLSPIASPGTRPISGCSSRNLTRSHALLQTPRRYAAGHTGTQMQGRIAAYARAQSLERPRRGRWEKARRGAWLPWASRCYGSRYCPTRHGCLPPVMIDWEEAEVVRRIDRLLVAEQWSGRQMTKRLNEAQLPTPSGHTQVWQPATVRHIVTNQVYAGQARYH